jgi:hypothetical protein
VGFHQPQEVAPRPVPDWAKSPWSVRGQLYRLANTLWEAGATPGTLIRTLGPWGPNLIQKYARNRCVFLPSALCLQAVPESGRNRSTC